jgi:hypothetical protein
VRGYALGVTTRPWPSLRDEDRWLTDAMEGRLAESRQSPEDMRARARELRTEADRTDIRGVREAKLALADRYEQAATARLTA